MTLYTVGYGYWPAPLRMQRLIAALKAVHVNYLIDVRLSPCSSSRDPLSSYGPKAWNLQSGDAGFAGNLKLAGIDYQWLVELGNPQKNDPAMDILKAHLSSIDVTWPVNRGLRLLNDIIQAGDRKCCLLCACKNFTTCHRKVIAEALRERFTPGVEIEDLSV